MTVALREGAPNPDAMWSPAIAAGANGYAITWSTNHGLYARVLEPTGTPRSAPVRLADDVSASAVAAGGRGFVVVWAGARRGVFARQLTRSGAIATPTTQISSDAHAYSLRIAARDGEIGIAWHTADGHEAAAVHFATLDSPARVVDGDGVAITTAHLSLAASPGGFAIAWEHCTPREDRRVRCAGDGQVSLVELPVGASPRRTVVAREPVGDALGTSSLAWHDGAWALVYASARTLHFLRFAGRVIATQRNVATGYRGSLAGTARGYGVGISLDERDLGWRELARDGHPTGRVVAINDRRGTAHSSAMAAAADVHAFVWIDTRSRRPALYFAALDAAAVRRSAPVRID